MEYDAHIDPRVAQCLTHAIRAVDTGIRSPLVFREILDALRGLTSVSLETPQDDLFAILFIESCWSSRVFDAYPELNKIFLDEGMVAKHADLIDFFLHKKCGLNPRAVYSGGDDYDRILDFFWRLTRIEAHALKAILVPFIMPVLEATLSPVAESYLKMPGSSSKRIVEDSDRFFLIDGKPFTWPDSGADATFTMLVFHARSLLQKQYGDLGAARVIETVSHRSECGELLLSVAEMANLLGQGTIRSIIKGLDEICDADSLAFLIANIHQASHAVPVTMPLSRMFTPEYLPIWQRLYMEGALASVSRPDPDDSDDAVPVFDLPSADAIGTDAYRVLQKAVATAIAGLREAFATMPMPVREDRAKSIANLGRILVDAGMADVAMTIATQVFGNAANAEEREVAIEWVRHIDHRDIVSLPLRRYLMAKEIEDDFSL